MKHGGELGHMQHGRPERHRRLLQSIRTVCNGYAAMYPCSFMDCRNFAVFLMSRLNSLN